MSDYRCVKCRKLLSKINIPYRRVASEEAADLETVCIKCKTPNKINFVWGGDKKNAKKEKSKSESSQKSV